MANLSYPHIGKKAHAVPYYFFGKQTDKTFVPWEAEKADVRKRSSSSEQFVVATTPESAQRGERAHRLVGRTLRVSRRASALLPNIVH